MTIQEKITLASAVIAVISMLVTVVIFTAIPLALDGGLR